MSDHPQNLEEVMDYLEHIQVGRNHVPQFVFESIDYQLSTQNDEEDKENIISAMFTLTNIIKEKENDELKFRKTQKEHVQIIQKDRKHLAEVNEVPPKFGRNWWYWRPRIMFDPFGKQGYVTRFQIKWLCCIYEVEWWN